MKSWEKTLDLSDLPVAPEGPANLEVCLKIKDRVLALDPDAREWRETDLCHYDADMLATEQDRRAFIEDFYEWADNHDVFVKHGPNASETV